MRSSPRPRQAAAVSCSTLYVVGGLELAGHDRQMPYTACKVLDLTDEGDLLQLGEVGLGLLFGKVLPSPGGWY
jgi:hypothetical protein